MPPAPGVLRSGCRCGPCGTKYNSSCGWEPTASFMTARNAAESQLCARGRFPSRRLAERAEWHGSRGAAQPFLPRAWLTYPPQPPVCQFAARSAAERSWRTATGAARLAVWRLRGPGGREVWARGDDRPPGNDERREFFSLLAGSAERQAGALRGTGRAGRPGAEHGRPEVRLELSAA